MIHIKRTKTGYDVREYEKYLAEHVDEFPTGMREYVSLPYLYNINHRKCPHDAWVEYIKIIESANDELLRQRHIDIEIRCLGSFHDGFFTLSYSNVLGYKIDRKVVGNESIGHSGWGVDEIVLLDSGKVHHEIILLDDGSVEITAEDIKYQWEDNTK